MTVRKIALASSILYLVILGACNDGNNHKPVRKGANKPDQGTKERVAQQYQSCPDSYRKLNLENSSIPGASTSISANDGVAKLSFSTAKDMKAQNLVVCIGKTDPVPAGVRADYVYDVRVKGSMSSLLSPKVTMNFTTNVVPAPNPPVIELARVANGKVTYEVLSQDPAVVTGSIYELSASIKEPGTYVVRLKR